MLELRNENREEQVANFRLKKDRFYKLLLELSEQDPIKADRLHEELINDVVDSWTKKFGKDVVLKSNFYHLFIGSSTDFERSPNLDLQGGEIEQYVTEVAIPRLEEEIKNLAK